MTLMLHEQKLTYPEKIKEILEDTIQAGKITSKSRSSLKASRNEFRPFWTIMFESNCGMHRKKSRG